MAPKVKNILFIAFQTGNSANGGLVSMTEILRVMKNDKLFIITQNKSHFNETWKTLGNVIELKWMNSLPSFLRIPLFNLLILCICVKYGINKAYYNDIDSAIHSGFGTKMLNIKSVFSIRGVKTESQAYGLKWKLAIKLSNLILVLSQEMKSSLMARLNIETTKKVMFVYSIVNKTNDKHKENSLLMSLEKKYNPLIGIPAAVYPLKQQFEFIKYGVDLILQKFPKAGFVFLGDYDKDTRYYRKCLSTAKSIGVLNNVEFLGYQENMGSWYKRFDCTLVVSQREGLSRTMIESLTYGTPVISFNVCSAQEVLQEHNCGRVVEQGNYKGLSVAVNEVLKSKNKLSDNAKNVASKLFTAENNKMHILKIFDEL